MAKAGREMRFSLEKEVMDKVLNYLGNQKYKDVVVLISEIQKSLESVAEPTTPSKTSKKTAAT